MLTKALKPDQIRARVQVSSSITTNHDSCIQVNMSIIMTVRSSCELETYIVAVERIKEYTELESEVRKLYIFHCRLDSEVY